VVVRIVAVIAILAVVGLYLRFTAQRLDGLHARVDAAGAALDAQLKRRGAAAASFALQASLLPQHAVAVSTAAAEAGVVRGLGHDREVAENALSRVLADVAAANLETFVTATSAAVELHDDATRANFARRFYNDAVRDALVVRDRRTVRWLRLAGSAPHPSYFEMDDEALPSPRIPVATRP